LLRKLALVLAVASGAGAASAAQVPFEASLAVQIASLPLIVFTGSGLATVNGSGGGAHLGALTIPAGVAGTAGYLAPVTDPGAFPIQGVHVTAANGAGVFALTGMGALAGSMPILGVAKVCPWTTGTAAVGAITVMGAAHGPGSLTSSTALSSGVVELVTPIFISTGIAASVVLPAFAFLTIHFVPEPGVLALVLVGLAALAVGSRYRAGA
jgi:hypothetical protein